MYIIFLFYIVKKELDVSTFNLIGLNFHAGL